MTTLRATLQQTRNGWDEYISGWQPWRNPMLYIGLLLAPAAIVGVMLYDNYLQGRVDQPAAHLEKIVVFSEAVGPWLLMAAAGVFLSKAALLRNRTYLLLGVVAVGLMLREFHWGHWIKVAIYPMLVGCGIWALVWWKQLDRPADNPWLSVLLFVALTTYALQQLVEKRLFRFLPNEDALHTQFEEVTEIAAHSLLLLTALLCSWRRKTKA